MSWDFPLARVRERGQGVRVSFKDHFSLLLSQIDKQLLFTRFRRHNFQEISSQEFAGKIEVESIDDNSE
jgi:hypothetical protein